MWAIVGLGNHPAKYARTRHNIGFRVVEELASRHSLKFSDKELYRIARGSIGGEDVVLVEPLTYMNRSGLAVRRVLGKSNATAETLIVVHDDIDMPTGRLKLRPGGSSGGHRGIESIIEHIGTRGFIRVKIGVGRDPGMLPEDYVLKKFGRDELKVVEPAVSRASDAIEAVLSEGLEAAMNEFNKRA